MCNVLVGHNIQTYPYIHVQIFPDTNEVHFHRVDKVYSIATIRVSPEWGFPHIWVSFVLVKTCLQVG